MRLLQLGLSDLGCDIRGDGFFGSTSARWVKDCQRNNGLPEAGVAEAALIVRLVG